MDGDSAPSGAAARITTQSARVLENGLISIDVLIKAPDIIQASDAGDAITEDVARDAGPEIMGPDDDLAMDDGADVVLRREGSQLAQA